MKLTEKKLEEMIIKEIAKKGDSFEYDAENRYVDMDSALDDLEHLASRIAKASHVYNAAEWISKDLSQIAEYIRKHYQDEYIGNDHY